ncbi:MAG: putative lipid II flippase FtsW [Gammaproteobacteria bacterium]|nr:putative lipid II flippase FtsW [Gammaproteobacteria bacterium]
MLFKQKPLPWAEQLSEYIDLRLLYVLLILMAVGITMTTSTTVEMAYKNGLPAFTQVKRQLIFMALGLMVMLMVSRISLRVWQRLGPLALLIAFALLILVLLPGIGRSVNGSSRWLAIGPFTLQVSEFAKVALIIYLAGYIVRHQERLRDELSAFINPMLVLLAFVALLMMEPDFGSSVVFVVIAFAMLFLGGARFIYCLTAMLLGGAGLALLAMSESYRLARLTGFMDPWADPQNTGFQLIQALIAIGNGGVFGVGLGDSMQKLFYLPEAHNDFVFAVLAEETGLLGVTLLLATYAFMIWRCFDLAAQAGRSGLIFAQAVGYGCSVWFALQTLISLGVNMGVLPTKGLSLPLISVGGSNFLATSIALGLMMRVYLEINQQGARRRSLGSSEVRR